MHRFAIVTGVSAGLGEALAARLLARGFDVLGVGRRRSLRLTEAGFTFVRADLARVDALDATLGEAFAAVASQRPAFVCLVNNAATVGSVGLVGTLGAAAIAADLAVNLAAPVIAADCFCRAITLRPGIIDTPMQETIRGQSAGRLPGVAMFRDFHASGRLVPAAEVAAKVVSRLVEGEIDNGRTYTCAEL